MRWHLSQHRRFHNVPSTISGCRFPNSINSERLLPAHVKIIDLRSYIKFNASLIIQFHPTFPPVSILSSVISLPIFPFYPEGFLPLSFSIFILFTHFLCIQLPCKPLPRFRTQAHSHPQIQSCTSRHDDTHQSCPCHFRSRHPNIYISG